LGALVGRAMTLKVRPMLAAQCEPARLRYPLIVQPKLDGIRVLIHEGVAYSRTLKPIRNKYIQERIYKHREVLEGVDGEIMVGDPTHPSVYRYTSSGVMSETGEPNFMLHVFDLWNVPGIPYQKRSDTLIARSLPYDVVLPVVNAFATTESELIAQHQSFVNEGYEGSILRDPHGLYKYNRSTAKEGLLIKFKDFQDAEAFVVGYEPKYHNANEATLDARGYTKRSSHQENKVPLEMLGALHCERDGITFKIGTGFDDSLRKELWEQRETLPHRIVKFKYFTGGAYDKPRFPVFLGFREQDDL
jgi:DNA ligase-1